MQGARRIITQPLNGRATIARQPPYEPRSGRRRSASLAARSPRGSRGATTSGHHDRRGRRRRRSRRDRKARRRARAARSSGCTSGSRPAPRREHRLAICFAFHAAARRRRRRAAAAPRRGAHRAAAPRRSPPPPLKLSGIAEDPGADGPVRTAIISGRRPAVHGQGRRDGHAALPRREDLRRRRRARPTRRSTTSAVCVDFAPAESAQASSDPPHVHPPSSSIRSPAARSPARRARASSSRARRSSIAHGDPAEVFVTERRATRASSRRRRVRRGARLVMAWGGDGTINEVASALAFGDVPLGIVPAGSATAWRASSASIADAAARDCATRSPRRRGRWMSARSAAVCSSTSPASASTRTSPRSSTRPATRRGFAGYVAHQRPRAADRYVPRTYTITTGGVADVAPRACS